MENAEGKKRIWKRSQFIIKDHLKINANGKDLGKLQCLSMFDANR